MKRKTVKQKFGDAECVYCGKRCDSSDHVPPKCLFAYPKRESLIEVPSCSTCNNGFSKDDEYLKIVFGILDLNEYHSEVIELQPSITRAFFKPEKKGFLKAFLKTIGILPRYTESGIYLGQAPAFEVDKHRLLRIAERVVKGLFYHERRTRLPDDFVVTPSIATDFSEDLTHDVGENGASLRRIIGGLSRKQSKSVGNGVFDYWVDFLDRFDAPNRSVWALRFYGTIDFLCLTHERESALGDRTLI